MNNKQLGTAFEREFCELLKSKGYWVHFMTPSANGSQPCDVIAVKDGEAYLIDCKTSTKSVFPISRIEDNQKFALKKWSENNNRNRFIAVKYNDKIYMIPYNILLLFEKVELTDEFLFKK